MKTNRESQIVVVLFLAVLGYLAYAIDCMNTAARTTNAKIEQMSNKRTVINKTIYWYKDEKHNLDFKSVSKV
jgi:outer membrane murein-binding lipoprotein Lpp